MVYILRLNALRGLGGCVKLIKKINCQTNVLFIVLPECLLLFLCTSCKLFSQDTETELGVITINVQQRTQIYKEKTTMACSHSCGPRLNMI